VETKSQIKKIVVIGPESTGKSTLCEQLAAHYQTLWVKEYAREYLEQHGTDYGFEDLYKIAVGQLRGEESGIRSRHQREGIGRDIPDNSKAANLQPSTFNFQPIFIDTDLYVIKVWSEFVFNKIDNRILTEIAKRKYDLYLLCDIDLPWIKDNLREYPDLKTREKLFYYYKEEMLQQELPWVIISGSYSERLEKAIEAVNAHIT
jgi:nicotinamide riboside kinase